MLIIVALALGAGGGTSVVAWRLGATPFLTTFGGLVAVSLAMLASAAVAVLLIAPRRVARELERMKRLPYAFNVDGYCGLLDEQHGFVTLRIEVRFTTTVPEAQRIDAMLAKIAERARIEEVTWRDDRTLAFSSPTIDTNPSAGATQSSYFTNHLVHRWMRTHGFPFLDALAARITPLARVEVDG